MRQRRTPPCILALAMLLSLALFGCAGLTQETVSENAPSPSSPDTEPGTPISEPELVESEPTGIEGWVRLEVEMIVLHREGDNIIEIPQLVWPGGEGETAQGLAVNQKILDFAGNYQAYLDGHPEGYTCEIQATANYINMYICIVMRKSYTPSYGTDGETAVFLYNYVLENEFSAEQAASEWALDVEGAAETVAAQAAAAFGRAVERCEFTSYAYVDMGALLFYNVTVNNEDGEPWVHNYAYLNPGYGEEPVVMTAAEAFALLKEAYPDLPARFDDDQTTVPEGIAAVSIGVPSSDGRVWSFSTEPQGLVEAVEYEAYEAWHQARWAEEYGQSEEMPLLDAPIPGNMYFYFKGLSPGVGTLHLAYKDPDQPETPEAYNADYRVEVFDDLTVRITQTGGYGTEVVIEETEAPT